VEETWKPATAGTLNIISGCFGIVGGVYIANIGGLEWDLPALVVAIVGVVGISRIALGVIALIGGIFARKRKLGGIFARKRKLWELALAGSIMAILCAPSLGILSTVFVSMSKKEFK